MADKVEFISKRAIWPIVQTEEQPTARLAAEEVQRYLLRMSDRLVPFLKEPPAVETPCIELLYEAGTSDGFVREVREDGIRLIGRSPRGLLCAVYDLLEELGCRWYAPGVLGERIPRLTAAALPVGIKDEEPYLRQRGLILGHEAYLADAEAWIDWAGKNRLNYLFFHPFPPPSWGGRYQGAWNRVEKRASQALQQRGMALEYGGHLLSELLPRRLFWRHKEAFRFDGQRRTADYNLCPSSAEARRLLRQRAEKFFLAHAAVQVFHVWPDDLEGGGWCSCPACEGLTPADQALMVTNELAEVLSEVAPQAIISFLAYHDTAATPSAVKPRANVALLYAPRERCYAHALDDPGCALNSSRYDPALESLVTWFRDSGWPEHQVFEYYLDGILFKSMAPPLGNLLAADVRAYRQHDCHHVGALITGDRPWLSPPLNGWLFSRLSWGPEQNPDALLRDYATNYYGGPVEAWSIYHQEHEVAFQLLLDLTPEEAERPHGGDALDFMEAPLQTRRTKLAALLEARKHLQQAGAHLEIAGRPGAGFKPRGSVTRAEVLGRELALFQLTCLQFDFLYYRQLAYCLMAERAARREIRAALTLAEKSLNGIMAWGRKELRQERRWLHQFRWTHHLWRLQLWSARREALSWTVVERSFWKGRVALSRKQAQWQARL